MRLRLLLYVSLGLLFLGFASHRVEGQTGIPPFSTNMSSSFDSVDVANLNVHFAIPVFSRPGRGIPFHYVLTYDGLVWTPQVVGSSGSWIADPNWGWKGQSEAAVGSIHYSLNHEFCQDPNTGRRYSANVYTNWYYRDTAGTVHPLPITTDDCTDGGPNPSDSGIATDGSGYSMSVTNYNQVTSLTDRSGNSITAPVNSTSGSGSIIDTNGNISQTDGTNFTDTLGTAIKALVISGTGTAASPKVYKYVAPSGSQVNVTVNYKTYTVRTAFACTGITEYGPTQVDLVDYVTLPDGTNYQFSYEATPDPNYPTAVTGRLSKVVTPTGATFQYSYPGSHDGVNCATGTFQGTLLALNRTTLDGLWQYQRTLGTGAASTTIVTDPSTPSNQTRYQFQGILQTKQEVFQGSTTGTLLETIDTCYNGNTVNCTSTAVPGTVSQITRFSRLPDSSGKTSRTDTFLNSYGLVTEKDEYDFGAASPTRKTIITYAIGDRPASVVIKNSANAVVSQTTYAYDAAGSLQPSPGTPPQHQGVTGARGNVSSITRTTGNTTLTQYFTNYDTGTVYTVSDINSATTIVATYAYDPACGYAFPISVSMPLNLSRSMTWDCNGGVMTSVKDENGNTTTYDFSSATDPFWRVQHIVDPLGNDKGFYYQPNASYSTPEIAWFMTFNGGSSQASDVQYFDVLGRIRSHQRKQSPNSSTLDTVSSTYDANGRLKTTSMPCSAGWVGACPIAAITQSYDALNRTLSTTDAGGGVVNYSYTQNDVYQSVGPAPPGEHTKDKQFEYDGLGRLISVCEVTTASGSGSCGQTSTATGFLTSYGYSLLNQITSVVQNNQASSGKQNRSFTYDQLGRLLTENNPESGTTTYVYDSDSSHLCSTSYGDLVKRIDAVGNVTCYSYDALHRLTSVTYPSGSYASVTPSKYYVYDSATVASVVMANAKGRVARAYTSSSIAFQNSDFESSSTLPPLGWSATGATLSYDTSTQLAGARSLKTAATQLYGGAFSSTISGVPGKTYTVSGYVKSDGTCKAYIQVRFLNASGAYLDSAQTAPTTQTAWGFVTATNVAPVGTVYLQLGLPNANSSGAGICEFDNISASSTYTTDLGFSYTQRGEIADVYESTPNSGGWYHVGGTYWANGALNQLTSSFAPITITYSADGEGRVDSVNASVGTNPVTSTTYNEAGQVKDVTLGSGDSDHYTYDPNTGRMRKYRFTIGATPQDVIGDLGWNLNGSLGSLTITDPFNPLNNNQVCNYSHDDLSRTTSVNCGSTWSQNFGFDPFGNINKSGSLNFAAGYVPTGGGSPNNRIQTGIPNVSYDANGNLLTINDGTNHAYTWGADGRPLGIDNVSATYDALGRMVELNNSGNHTETVYGLAGEKLALMNAQTLNKAFVAIPSGTAVFDSSGLIYYRHSDWLGSSRFASTLSRTMYSDSAYAPFGEQYVQGGSSDQSFTGQQADTAAGLYDFMFRRLSQIQGRWISPDPAGISVVDPKSPQTWNQYAYVANSPLAATDPYGLVCSGNVGDYADTVCNPSNSGGGGGSGGFDSSVTIWQQQGSEWEPGPYGDGGKWAYGYDITTYLFFGTGGYYDSGGGGTAVSAVRNDLLNKLISDGLCLTLLGSRGAAVFTAIAAVPINVAPIGNQSLGANTTFISPSVDAPNPYVPKEAQITVNSNGFGLVSRLGQIGFHNSRGRLVNTMINSGSPRALAFVLLHEFGHVTGVLAPDLNNQANEDFNNSQIASNCKQTIQSFSNTPSKQ